MNEAVKVQFKHEVTGILHKFNIAKLMGVGIAPKMAHEWLKTVKKYYFAKMPFSEIN